VSGVMLRSPILWKLFGSYIALAAVCLLAAGVATQRILARSAERDTEHALFEHARTLSPVLEPAVARGDADLEARVRELARATGDRITILRLDGSVVADSPGDAHDVLAPVSSPEFREAVAGGTGTAVRRGG